MTPWAEQLERALAGAGDAQRIAEWVQRSTRLLAENTHGDWPRWQAAALTRKKKRQLLQIDTTGRAGFDAHLGHYVAGAPENATDFLYQRLNAKEQDAVTVDFHRTSSDGASFSAHFPIVLGNSGGTPQLG